MWALKFIHRNTLRGMKMATLTVTFTNGKTLTRNTDKPYTHAWIATGGRNVEMGLILVTENDRTLNCFAIALPNPALPRHSPVKAHYIEGFAGPK